MDELKRKISEELDEHRSAELSDDLVKEIESSGDLRGYADELVRIETYLQQIKDCETLEPEWKSIYADIRTGIEEVAMSGNDDEKILDAPAPDGSDEDVAAADGDKKSGPEDEKKSEIEDEDDDKPRMRLTATKLSSSKKSEKESSGLLNLGALVQEHRASMVPISSGGSLDIPPAVVASGSMQHKGGSKLVPVVIVLGVLAVVAIVAVVGVKSLGKKDVEPTVASTAEIDREAIEKEIYAKVLAELKAEGATAEEAEAKASEQAKLLAKAEIEKQEAAAGDGEGEEEDSSSPAGSSKKHKKKNGAGTASTTPSTSATDNSAGYVPKSTSSTSGTKTTPTKPTTESKVPKTAADDLASLLEGGVGAKKGSDSGSFLGDTTEKPTKAPAPPPAVSSDPNLPEKLDKKDIRKAMNKIQPKIMQCGKDKLGTLTLQFVILNTGAVKSVQVKAGNKFASDPAGKCAENVAQGAKFDPFKNPTQSIEYHFVFAPTPGM